MSEKTTAKKAEKNEEKEEKGFIITRTARKAAETCRNTLDDYSEKYVKPVMDSGKKIKDRVKKDAGNAVNGVLDRGRKIIPEIPGMKTVEKKFNGGIEAAAGYMNLPTKSDIENLTTALENLSSKMDLLANNK